MPESKEEYSNCIARLSRPRNSFYRRIMQHFDWNRKREHHRDSEGVKTKSDQRSMLQIQNQIRKSKQTRKLICSTRTWKPKRRREKPFDCENSGGGHAIFQGTEPKRNERDPEADRETEATDLESERRVDAMRNLGDLGRPPATGGAAKNAADDADDAAAAAASFRGGDATWRG